MDQSEAAKAIEDNVAATVAWIREGIDKGFCSDAICSTHTADYLREEEATAMWDGDDPCIFVLRLWDA
jgi:hypothetical protein